MPSVPLHTPSTISTIDSNLPNPLPTILQTPAGLALIEIQGSLHIPSATVQSDTTEVGKLVFPLYDPEAPADALAWMWKVHLYVGRHQRLTGEVKKLEKGKCIGVVRRVEGDGEGSGSEQGLEIVDVIRYKILFQGRPEPVDTMMGS